MAKKKVKQQLSLRDRWELDEKIGGEFKVIKKKKEPKKKKK